MEAMTSSERVLAVMRGEKPDRVPVFCCVGGYAAKLSGMSLKAFYQDVECCVRAQVLAKELHGYDDAPNYGWADWGGGVFGGGTVFPDSYEQGAPRSSGPAIEKPSDIDLLEIPDPGRAGMFPLLARFNRVVAGMGLPAKIRAGSVTSLVSAIIGTERLLRWYIREPAAVHAAYDKATEFILKAADATIREFGLNCSATYGAPLDSNDLVSEKIFSTFALPRIKQINRWLMDRGVSRFFVHLCGNHMRNIHGWAEVPWPDRTIFSLGSETDMIRVAEVFGHRHVTAGNVSTTRLATGGFDEVYDEACRCIQRHKDLPGGFFLMSACETPSVTPPVNVHAMVKAVRDVGRHR